MFKYNGTYIQIYTLGVPGKAMNFYFVCFLIFLAFQYFSTNFPLFNFSFLVPHCPEGHPSSPFPFPLSQRCTSWNCFTATPALTPQQTSKKNKGASWAHSEVSPQCEHQSCFSLLSNCPVKALLLWYFLHS